MIDKEQEYSDRDNQLLLNIDDLIEVDQIVAEMV
jgi:hypothetical protein